jgi:hypothetical protein
MAIKDSINFVGTSQQKKRKSDAPYFVHYDKFIEAGNYTLRAYFGETVAEQSVKVVAGNSPYLIKE